MFLSVFEQFSVFFNDISTILRFCKRFCAFPAFLAVFESLSNFFTVFPYFKLFLMVIPYFLRFLDGFRTL